MSRRIDDKFALMNPANDTLIPGSQDDFDEPYIHTVSTAEFVEAVERENRTESDDLPASDVTQPWRLAWASDRFLTFTFYDRVTA